MRKSKKNQSGFFFFGERNGVIAPNAIPRAL